MRTNEVANCFKFCTSSCKGESSDPLVCLNMVTLSKLNCKILGKHDLRLC